MLHSVFAMLLLGVLLRALSNPYCAAVFGIRLCGQRYCCACFQICFFLFSLLLCVVVDLCCVGVVPFLGAAAVVDLWFFLFVDFASSGGAFPCVIAVRKVLVFICSCLGCSMCGAVTCLPRMFAALSA